MGPSGGLPEARSSHGHGTQGPVAGPSGTSHDAERGSSTDAQNSEMPTIPDTTSVLQIVCP